MIEGFNSIGLHEIENNGIIVYRDGVTEHSLGIILIKLEIFGLLPVGSVILSKQLPTCEPVDAGDIVAYIAGLHDVIF